MLRNLTVNIMEKALRRDLRRLNPKANLGHWRKKVTILFVMN
jgi:hypothetical protein